MSDSSPTETAFVTGATGMVGSHLAERLVADGARVRCLVRETSDTRLLEELGVELVRGDVTDPPEVLREAVGRPDVVYHCAAMVDDWASRDAMMRVNVDGVRNLLEACEGLEGLRKVVMVGSMVVFGMGPQNDLDESAPLVHTGDNYNYTKILAFELATRFAEERGLPLAICRPPYIYGLRDRQFFPRIFDALKTGRWKYIGDGNQPITLCYVKNLVECLVRAGRSDCPPGELFLVTDGEAITRRELAEMVCEEMGYPKPKAQVPVGVAKALLPLVEWLGKVRGKKPILNRFQLKFMATPTTFDVSKARRVLGYEPVEPPRESLRKTIRWFAEHHPEVQPEA